MRLRYFQGDCPGCGVNLAAPGGSRVIGVQYSYDSPNHYDGVSEWRCPDCDLREGRWSGKILKDGESEPRYGGKPCRLGHPS